jgi:hypothetical protein
MTPEIREEWDKHQSRFARHWRVQMNARKKFKGPDSDNAYTHVLENVKHAMVTFDDRLMFKRDKLAIEKDQAAIEKDWCLIVAALNSERLITSLDEIMRRLLAEASEDVIELYEIIWVNPDNTDEEPITWLELGAPSEKWRCLGRINE